MSSNNAMTPLGYLRYAREWASPVLKKSAFMEKGVITPEEFVRAGDDLVFRCPTWAWQGGDPKWAKPYLPKDKQYLITRRIPCQKRVAEMENMTTDAAAGDGDEDWLLSHLIQDKTTTTALEDEFDILDEEGEVVEKKAPELTNAETAPDGGQDEYADMADFEDDNVLEDDVAAAAATTTAGAFAAQHGDNDDDDHDNNNNNSNLVKVRTYDVSITYDKYYQTPRVWMLGYDADGQPLTGKQMLEDVISDYANRTVTIEAHPHVAGPHASIHPCKHGAVMKAIVRNLIKSSNADGGSSGEAAVEEGPSIEMYLFIFLKFVSSIIPTINYDFTMDVRADTRK